MKWKDKEGREWFFKFNVLLMKEIKQELGIDLTQAISPSKEKGDQVFEQLIGDIVLQVEIMVIVLRNQMRSRNLTEDDLAELLDNEEHVQLAVRAMMEGLCDYFPKDQAGAIKRALAQSWEKIAEIADRQNAKAIERINQIDFGKLVEEELNKSEKIDSQMSGG